MSDAYDLREVRMQHPNARYAARGRLDLVLFAEQGHSYREAARAFRCSVSTAFTWVGRWRRASISERVNSSPDYAQPWSTDSKWRQATHHREHPGATYLLRHLRAWDQMAISAVTRDRYWLAAARDLVAV